jgi:hypothetical protein
MFGRQNRIDEAETARAGWGDTNKWKNAARDAIRVPRERWARGQKK